MAPASVAVHAAPAGRSAAAAAGCEVVAPAHLAVRWLGRVGYDEAWALQRGLHAHSARNHLLLLEHPHVITMGPRAEQAHVLVDPAAAGAEMCRTDRGGDVTYHGPGQLVGYPILTLGGPRAGGLGAAAAYVESLEDLLIEVLADLGLRGAGRLERHRGVWLDATGVRPRKIAAIGVRVRRGRTLHGFALNVDPDLSWFGRIVPCGIREHPVTSLIAEGVVVTMPEVVDAVATRAAQQWGTGGWDRADVAAPSGRRRRPEVADVAAVANESRALEISVAAGRKPSWMRVVARTGPEFRRIKSHMRDLDLVTVCEEAGCPNIYECWEQGTATFMLGGERCTRACGFCLIDTRRPEPLDPDEPERVATAVARMELDHAVVTAVARDDVPDGGAAHFAACIRAIRRLRPSVTVEVLIPDCKGDATRARHDLRRASRCAEPQHRDRGAVAADSAPLRRLRPEPGGAGKGEGCRTHDQVLHHGGTRRDRRRGDRGAGRPRRGRLRHRHHRPVPAPQQFPPAGDALVAAGGVRDARGDRAGTGHRPRRVQPADALELPRRGSGPLGRGTAPKVSEVHAATVLLQWAAGGLVFGWVTTRRREVGPGYGWLLRSLYAALAALAGIIGVTAGFRPARDVAALGAAAVAFGVLTVSFRRRGAPDTAQTADALRRRRRVAAMLGRPPAEPESPEGPRFSPALDLAAPLVALVGVVAGGVVAGGPVALSVARVLVGALFFGAVSDAMLLGHWYLVQPGLRRAPLVQLVRWSMALWVAETVVLLWPTGVVSIMTGTVDDGLGGLLGWYWVMCAAGSAVLLGATEAALKIRRYAAVMAGTGLLYLAIMTAFGMDLIARVSLRP